MDGANWFIFKSLAVLLLLGLLSTVFEAKSVSPQNIKSQVNVEASSFTELVDKGHAFVDKTLFIKDFLEAKLVPQTNDRWAPNTTDIMRVSYPRKWGKTMNMKMIEDFLQMEVDESGDQISPKETAAYRLFALGKTASGHDVRLNIASHRRIIDKYLAQHPVIYVSFKNVTGSNFAEIFKGMKQALAETFKKHAYMTKVFKNALKNGSTNDKATKETKESLDKFQAMLSSTANDLDALYSLDFLSGVLHKHFGKAVFLLLDDYDQPFLSLVTQMAPNMNELKRIREYALYLLEDAHNLLGHRHYEQSLINGIVRVIIYDDYGCHSVELKYFAEFNVFENRFAKYYGFDEEEVSDLFAQCGIDARLAADAKKWYKGYTTNRARYVDVYNPYDVSKFAHDGKISNYWVRSGAVPFSPYIFRNKLVESCVLSLLNKETVVIEADDSGFSTKQLEELATALNPSISALSNPLRFGYKANLYYEYLVMTGYLTLNKSTESLALAHVRLPNEEIVLEFASLMVQHYRDTFGINAKVQNRLTKEVKRLPEVNDTAALQNSLEEYFSLFPGFVDRADSKNGQKENEDVINSAFNMLTLITKGIYHLNSEIYLIKNSTDRFLTSKLRPNIVLTLEKMKLGVVIPLTFNVTAEKALGVAENYAKVFDDNKNIKQIKLMAINIFPNKTVKITESWKVKP